MSNERESALRLVGDGRIIAGRVRHAASFRARLFGLIGRSSLDPDEGLYIPGANGIHMLFMRFPIDCLFVSLPDPDGVRHVVAIRSRVRPWLGVVWYVRGAKGVVELAAGTLERAGVRAGDGVRLEPEQISG